MPKCGHKIREQDCQVLGQLPYRITIKENQRRVEKKKMTKSQKETMRTREGSRGQVIAKVENFAKMIASLQSTGGRLSGRFRLDVRMGCEQ